MSASAPYLPSQVSKMNLDNGLFDGRTRKFPRYSVVDKLKLGYLRRISGQRYVQFFMGKCFYKKARRAHIEKR